MLVSYFYCIGKRLPVKKYLAYFYVIILVKWFWGGGGFVRSTIFNLGIESIVSEIHRIGVNFRNYIFQALSDVCI